MSAPRTNIETQKRWHRAPLLGMIVVVVFALGLLFWQMVKVADEGTPQDSGAAEIDGRTGGPVPGSDTPPSELPAAPDSDLPPAEIPTPAPDVEIPPAPATKTP